MPWPCLDSPTCKAIEEIANSAFGTALVAGGLASLAGAWGGAKAAQYIADKNNRKKALTDEIKACNAGIDAAGSILNEFIAFRADPYLPMKRDYDEQRGLLEVRLAGAKDGWLPKRVEVPLNGASFLTIRVPVARLESVMFERVSLTTRAQALANKVVQGVGLMNDTISARERFIVEMQAWPEAHKVLRAYAFPVEGLGLDNRYLHYMEQFGEHADDVIHFSAELCKVLEKHGKRLEERFQKKYRGVCPQTNRMHFEKPEAAGLLPDPKRYEWFERQWLYRPPATEDRRLGKIWHAGRKKVRWPWRLVWKLRGLGKRKKKPTASACTDSLAGAAHSSSVPSR